MQVLVRDNNVDQALKALKKKMQREGIFREMKLRNYYEKPSEKRVREQAEAVRRARKLARKRAQREGLLPGKAAAAKPGAKPGAGGRPGGPGRGGAGGPPRTGGVGGPPGTTSRSVVLARRVELGPKSSRRLGYCTPVPANESLERIVVALSGKAFQ